MQNRNDTAGKDEQQRTKGKINAMEQFEGKHSMQSVFANETISAGNNVIETSIIATVDHVTNCDYVRYSRL